MARFKFKGEVPRSFVASYGPTTKIRVPQHDGTTVEITAADEAIGFVIGEDIGAEFTDARSVRVLRADPRFEEIV